MGSCFDSFFFGGHFFAPKDNIIEDPLSHGLAYGGCWICLAIRTQADGLNSFFSDIAGAFSRVQQHRFGCFQTWLITQYEVSQHSSFFINSYFPYWSVYFHEKKLILRSFFISEKICTNQLIQSQFQYRLQYLLVHVIENETFFSSFSISFRETSLVYYYLA